MNMPRGRDLAPPRDPTRTRARRRVLVLVLVVLLAAGGFLGWLVLIRPGDDLTASSSCPSELAAGTLLPVPQQVGLEVLNSTSVDGLASRTAEELAARGFAITRVGNLPAAAPLATTEIHVRPDARPAGDLVALHVTGATVVEEEGLAVPVDVRLGEGFAGLAPLEQVATGVAERDAAARDVAVADAPERCHDALRTAPGAVPTGFGVPAAPSPSPAG